LSSRVHWKTLTTSSDTYRLMGIMLLSRMMKRRNCEPQNAGREVLSVAATAHSTL
jgi:hypothetical protein